ncbi:MAG: flagellar hook-length control protein FliK [Syntrophales bacterium]|nr:flagellar hook-length control protein FliK [Syntrophales bacterium]MDD5531205.1 flagellar hook-length control protein FliK [Syntrophales bacterium]
MQDINIQGVSKGILSRRARKAARKVQGDQALMFMSMIQGSGHVPAHTKARSAACRKSLQCELPAPGMRSAENNGKKIPALKMPAAAKTEAKIPAVPAPAEKAKEAAAAGVQVKEDLFKTAAESLKPPPDGKQAAVAAKKERIEPGKIPQEAAKEARAGRAVAEEVKKQATADLRPENANKAAIPPERPDIFGQALKATIGTERGRSGRREAAAGANSAPAGAASDNAERPAMVMMQEKTAAKTAFLQPEQNSPASPAPANPKNKTAPETAEKKAEETRASNMPRKPEGAQQFAESMRRKEIETVPADRESAPVRTVKIDSARPEVNQALKMETAARPAEASAAVKPEPVITQVAAGVQTAVDRGVSRIRLEIQPPNLGILDMDLVVNRDKVRMVIMADNQEVGEVLRSNAEQLKAALEGQGLKMDSLDVFVQDRSAGERSGGFREFASFRDGSGSGQRNPEPSGEQKLRSSAPNAQPGMYLETGLLNLFA